MSDIITKSPQIRFTGFTDAWEQRKLGDVVEFFSGLTYSPDNVIEDGGTFVLRSSNVKNGEIVDADNVYVKSDIVKSDNVQVGDIIVVVRNGSRDLIGKHAQIKKQMNDTVIGAFMTGIRSETPNFTNALLDTQQFSVEINKNLGATINQITIGAFKKMMFYIPVEKDEREKVGTFFNGLDNQINLHQRKLELLKEMKKSLLQKAFPKDGSDVPEIRFAGFTDAWEQRKFSEMFRERRDKTKVENEDTLLSCAINGMFLNSELFGHFRGSSTIGYLKVKKNDLILSAQNLHLGNANVNQRFEHGIISPAYKVYELIDSEPNFIQAWVKKDETKKFFLSASTEGASQCRKNIEWDKLYKQSMFVPTYKEQEAIGALFLSLDNLITLHQRELDSLKNLKRSLLQQMFV